MSIDFVEVIRRSSGSARPSSLFFPFSPFFFFSPSQNVELPLLASGADTPPGGTWVRRREAAPFLSFSLPLPFLFFFERKQFPFSHLDAPRRAGRNAHSSSRKEITVPGIRPWRPPLIFFSSPFLAAFFPSRLGEEIGRQIIVIEPRHVHSRPLPLLLFSFPPFPLLADQPTWLSFCRRPNSPKTPDGYGRRKERN